MSESFMIVESVIEYWAIFIQFFYTWLRWPLLRNVRNHLCGSPRDISHDCVRHPTDKWSSTLGLLVIWVHYEHRGGHLDLRCTGKSLRMPSPFGWKSLSIAEIHSSMLRPRSCQCFSTNGYTLIREGNIRDSSSNTSWTSLVVAPIRHWIPRMNQSRWRNRHNKLQGPGAEAIGYHY